MPSYLTTLASEDFTIESSLSPGWTVGRASSAFSAPTGLYLTNATNGTRPYVFYSGISFPNNQWSQCTIGQCYSGVSPYSAAGPGVRCAGGDNFYAYYNDGVPTTNAFLFSVVNGVLVYSGNSPPTPVPGDVLRLDVLGQMLYAYRNGVLQFSWSVTGSTLASGSPGIQGINVGTNALAANSEIFSNWSAGSFVSPTPPLVTVLASDSFPGASLSGNWVVTTGGFSVSGGICHSAVNNYNEATYNSGLSFPDNQWSSVLVGTDAVITNYWGVSVRSNISNTNGYQFFISGQGITTLQKNNSNVVAGSVGRYLGIGDVIMMTVVGNTIKGYLNGFEVLTYTDTSSPITSGLPGLALYGLVGISNWQAGSMGLAGVPNSLMLMGCGT